MGNETWPMIARVCGHSVACSSVLYLLLGVESVTRMKLSHVVYYYYFYLEIQGNLFAVVL